MIFSVDFSVWFSDSSILVTTHILYLNKVTHKLSHKEGNPFRFLVDLMTQIYNCNRGYLEATYHLYKLQVINDLRIIDSSLTIIRGKIPLLRLDLYQ